MTKGYSCLYLNRFLKISYLGLCTVKLLKNLWSIVN